MERCHRYHHGRNNARHVIDKGGAEGQHDGAKGNETKGVVFYDKFGLVGGAIISAVYPFILATGMQVAFSPFTVINLSTLGYDYIYPMTAASNAAMGACALYVYFKAKNKNVKAMGLSTGITGLIGVTEPVLFGFFGNSFMLLLLFWAVR